MGISIVILPADNQFYLQTILACEARTVTFRDAFIKVEIAGKDSKDVRGVCDSKDLCVLIGSF